MIFLKIREIFARSNFLIFAKCLEVLSVLDDV